MSRAAAGGPPADPGPSTGSGAGSDRPAAAAAVADAHRREWAFVLAATARVAGDLDLAEECVQDALRARRWKPGPGRVCRATPAPG